MDIFQTQKKHGNLVYFFFVFGDLEFLGSLGSCFGQEKSQKPLPQNPPCWFPAIDQRKPGFYFGGFRSSPGPAAFLQPKFSSSELDCQATPQALQGPQIPVSLGGGGGADGLNVSGDSAKAHRHQALEGLNWLIFGPTTRQELLGGGVPPPGAYPKAPLAWSHSASPGDAHHPIMTGPGFIAMPGSFSRN